MPSNDNFYDNEIKKLIKSDVSYFNYNDRIFLIDSDFKKQKSIMSDSDKEKIKHINKKINLFYEKYRNDFFVSPFLREFVIKSITVQTINIKINDVIEFLEISLDLINSIKNNVENVDGNDLMDEINALIVMFKLSY